MRSHNKSNAHDSLKSKYIVHLPLLSTPFTKYINNIISQILVVGREIGFLDREFF